MKSKGIRLCTSGTLLYGLCRLRWSPITMRAGKDIGQGSCLSLSCIVSSPLWSKMAGLGVCRCILLISLFSLRWQSPLLPSFSCSSIVFWQYLPFSWSTIPMLVWMLWLSAIFSILLALLKNQFLACSIFWPLRTQDIFRTIRRFIYRPFSRSHQAFHMSGQFQIQSNSSCIVSVPRPRPKLC